jgi:nucleoside-diphosphate-sugar epimerase
LARRLVAENWDVHAIVRPRSTITRLADLPLVIHVDDGVEPLHEMVAAAAPDVCFHLAGYFVGAHRDDDVTPLITNNLLFGTRLIDAIAQHGGCCLINAGSYWQNAGGRAYHPVALYAATKQAFEDIVQFYVESAGLKVVTVKFFETYGPFDPRPKLVNLLLKAALLGQPIGISPGRQLIDLVHVDDAARACLAAARLIREPDGSPQSSYAASSGAPLSLRDLVERVGQIIGREVPVLWGETGYRWREMMEPWDVAPIVPGWVSTISLHDGISEMWRILSRPEAPGDIAG